MTAFDFLSQKYGQSAATTYWWNREGRHNLPATEALRKTRDQVKELGAKYTGGLECTKFRREERQS